jgi:hypothetical protein
MTEPDHLCVTCSFSEHRVTNGNDWIRCTHADLVAGPDGKQEHPMAFEQRIKVADQPANICGADGIFWTARE